MKLTEAQWNVLSMAHQFGGIWRGHSELWNWYCTHPQGYVMRVGSNQSVEILLKHGLLTKNGADKAVTTIPGRRALSEQGAEK